MISASGVMALNGASCSLSGPLEVETQIVAVTGILSPPCVPGANDTFVAVSTYQCQAGPPVRMRLTIAAPPLGLLGSCLTVNTLSIAVNKLSACPDSASGSGVAWTVNAQSLVQCPGPGNWCVVSPGAIQVS